MGPFVTINGAAVDATIVIDALVGKIGEMALENAALRAQVAAWSSLAHAQVVEGAPDGFAASEAPTEGSDGPLETASGPLPP